MHEYTTAVFAVGLEGFAQVDNDRITAMAAEGWEPTHMTPCHNGFAAVVLFRREAGAAPGPSPRPVMTRTRKTPPKAAPPRAAAPAKRARSR